MIQKKTIAMIVAIALIIITPLAFAKKPPASSRSKFYDFSDQLIDGEIKKPTALYTDARKKVKFERLLRLKKSFLRPLFDTAREKVFK